MYECPRHHQSETPDYCSVCGVEIASAAALPARGPATEPASDAPTALTAESTEQCPECGAAKESSQQVFCEVCGYNFRTRRAGARPFTSGPASGDSVAGAPNGTITAASVAPAEPSDIASQTSSTLRWDVVVQVDPCLYGTVNPAAPTGRPEQIFSLFEAENIVGRATPTVRVQVPITHDAGVSRRHAVLQLRPSRDLSVRDLGSANGIQLNGVELLPGVETMLKDGDVLAIGAWTRMTIRAVHE